MLTGYIYVITNDINGKQYVGKTTDTIENRFKDHCKDYMLTHCSHRPLYYAMNKYGREHFSITQLEECPLEILGEREQYWIEKLDTYKNGYNGTHGGDGSQLYDYNLFIADYNQGMNIEEISKKYGCGRDTVSKALKKANLDTFRGVRQAQRNNSCKVYQYDMKGNFIQEFHSYWAAAQWIVNNHYTTSVNINQIDNNIRGAVRKNYYRKSAYGFRWESIKVEKLPELILKYHKPVQCLETSEIFPDTITASQWCNLHNKESIRKNCRGEQKSAGKHPITGEKLHWKYIEE